MKIGKIIFFIVVYLVVEALNFLFPIVNWELILIIIMAKIIADYLNKHLRQE